MNCRLGPPPRRKTAADCQRSQLVIFANSPVAPRFLRAIGAREGTSGDGE